MRIISLAVLSSFIALVSTEAAEVELTEVFKKCRETIAPLTFAHYTVKGTRLDAEPAELRLEWRESGDKCWYKYVSLDGSGNENFCADYSFDGERSMRSFYNRDRIDIRKGAWSKVPDWIRNMEMVTSPFEFALQSLGTKRWDTPSIDLLKSDEIWSNLSKNAQIVGSEKYKGNDCVVVRINQGTHRLISDLTTYYVVYFDRAKSFFPIAWKQFNEKNELLSELEVTEEQVVKPSSSVSLRLPKQLKISYYAFNKEEVQQKPTTSWLYEFGNVSTESTSEERDDFVLDMASVRLIYDEDQHVFIRVPN